MTASIDALTKTATIESIDDVFDNIRIIRATVDHGRALGHKAGQYVMLSLAAGLDPRPFSIASTPDLPYVEFHIRNTGHGPASLVLAALKPGDRIHLGAPTGNGYWRQSGRPLLALAGGTGIAPLNAVLDAHFADAAAPAARLYWGARTKEHLYLDSHFRAQAQAHPSFRYVPILSDRSDQDEDPLYRNGFIGDALAEDFPALDGFAIYLAGPGMMLQSLVPQLLHMGAEKDFIFGDFLFEEAARK